MDDNKSRTNKITVRLNDVELSKIQIFADVMQLPMSEAVRQLIQPLKWYVYPALTGKFVIKLTSTTAEGSFLKDEPIIIYSYQFLNVGYRVKFTLIAD